MSGAGPSNSQERRQSTAGGAVVGLLAGVLAASLIVLPWRRDGDRREAPPGGGVVAAAPSAGPAEERPTDATPAGRESPAADDPSQPRGTKVRGRVFERGTDRPVEGARVTAADPASAARTVAAAATDALGRYELDLPRGPYVVEVVADGHAPTLLERRYRKALGSLNPDLRGLPAPEEPLIQVGEVPVERDFVVDPAPVIRGRVVDGRGFPVDGARVSVALAVARHGRAWISMSIQESSTATTDAEGRFSLSALLSSGIVALDVRRDGFQDGRHEIDVAPGIPEVTLALARGLFLAGTVRDGQGHPLPGASLLACATEGDGLRLQLLSERSGELGGFSGSRPVSGSIAVAWKAGHRPAVLSLATSDPTQLDFILPAADARLSGYVRDPAGRPVEGAVVRVTQFGSSDGTGTVWLGYPAHGVYSSSPTYTGFLPPAEIPPSTQTGPDGAFELASLPLGDGASIVLAVESRGRTQRHEVREAGRLDVVFESEK